MKFPFYLITAVTIFIFVSCGLSQIKKTTKEEPVVIQNDSLEYKIIIIEQGFTSYLHTIAKPVGYYSQGYLENKNQFYVTIWNQRASNPIRYSPSIYENNINYDFHINYGYDVNYKLFNYFEFVQRKYRMRLH